MSKIRNVSWVHDYLPKLCHLKLLNYSHDPVGYKLSYGGLDYLALHAHEKAGILYSVGNEIGKGKESDIIAVSDKEGKQMVLKLHRLGRISFRDVKQKRHYTRRGQHVQSWHHLSGLAAHKEHTFMEKLFEEGFPVPRPIARNRHSVVMELIDGFPLRQLVEVQDPAALYAELMELILRLARHGLIHGDFNEFNILIKEIPIAVEDGKEEKTDGEDKEKKTRPTPVIIDFPQMVSMMHSDAQYYFERDVECIKSYFRKRYGFTSDDPGPLFKDAKKEIGRKGAKLLDVEAYASGFSRKMAKELEEYLKKPDDLDQEAGSNDSDSYPNDDEDEDEDEGITSATDEKS
jgi:RIO kinase 2